MLNSLTYSVLFSETGRSIDETISFQKGLTAITGCNESGKSFCIEMFRFALFGSAALRGVGDDYKKLNAKASLTIKGATYDIDRSLSNAKLICNDEPVAVGTRPVNQKIQSILGFDLGVFDVACAANQHEAMRLGDMKPTERKRMVDQVIGLDRMDALQKWTNEERLLVAREVEVLERNLVEPVAPSIPEQGVIDAAAQSETVAAMRETKAEFDRLIGWLAHNRSAPVIPPAPTCPSEADLIVELDAWMLYDAEKRALMALPVSDGDPTLWAAWDHSEERRRFEEAHPRPDVTVDQIAEQTVLIGVDEELFHLKEQSKRLSEAPHVDCPNCGTNFSLEHEQMTKINERIEELLHVEPPTMTWAQIRTEEARHADWTTTATVERWDALKDIPVAEKPQGTRPAPGSITIAQRDQKLADLGVAPVRGRNEIEADLASQRRFQAENERYAAELSSFQSWKEEERGKRARAEELSESVTRLPAEEQKLQIAQAYEREMGVYEAQKAVYDARSEEIAVKKGDVEGWKKASAALTEIRTRVKTYLVPSLSKVASHLLAQMTGGQRSSIHVDDNFDITVDGQRLETLSGSGKVCANIALRIGLGQVLTNNTLSIFIGDEIDESMDEDRAAFTQDSLGSLTNSISQIFLVTHKVPSAEHIVRLGK